MEELKEDYSGLSREEVLELAKKWSVESRTLMKNYQFAEAILLIQKVLPIYKQYEKWSAYIDSRNNMITIVSHSFNFELLQNPIAYWEETFALIQKKISTDYNRIYKSLTVITTFYGKMGEFDKALVYAKRNLLLVEKHYEPDAKEVIWVYQLLATIYSKLGDYPQAIAIHLKIIPKCLRTSNNQGLLITYTNLSLEYIYYDEQELAISISKKALKLAIQLEDKSVTILSIYNNMSLLYYNMGDYQQEVIYSRKGFEESLTLLGADHPSTLKLQQNLGIALNRLQEFNEALFHLQTALKKIKEKLGPNHLFLGATYQILNEYYRKRGNYLLALEYAQKAFDICLISLGREHPSTLISLKEVAIAFSLLQKKERAIETFEEVMSQAEKIWGKTNHKTANIYRIIAAHYLRNKNTQSAILYILKAEKIILQRDKKETLSTQNFMRSKFLLPISELKGRIFLQHYHQNTQTLDDLKKAVETFEQSIEILDKMRQGYHTQGSKLVWNATESKLYEEGIGAALEMMVFGMEAETAAFQFSEKAKASLLLNSLQTEHAKTTAQISTELQEEEKQMKLKLTYLDKRIQKLQSKKEKAELNEYENLSLKESQDEFFHLHQSYTAFLQQLETDYPDYYQLKYDTKIVTPTELQSILQENQVVISYFVGEEKLYIFIVTSDEFEVIDLQKPTDFEALIEEFMAALTQHQFADFKEKSHQLYQLLIAPIRDFIVDDFGFDDEEDELKQVFVIPHGVLSYLPFEALIGEDESLSRSATVDKVEETLSTAESLDNNSSFEGGQGDVWNRLNYLIHHCEISYHYSATLLHRHLLKKQTQEEFPNSFAGFAPIYDENTPRSSKSTTSIPLQSEALQQSAKSMQSWATRSDAIRSDGTWVSLPHSETEAKNITKLFEEHGLEAETFLREKASKEGFTEAAKQFKFLLVAAHGLVNDEKTALSGLVFYPSDRSERQDEGSEMGKSHDTQAIERGGLKNLTSHFSHPTSQIDSILSMEETHHLDLQADLVVLSSCESGIGTLHKGEGMMAVNRGFLAAGANNVVSTLFKVYDKPSSLLTQYLFEAILQGKTYSAALRVAKLKLMQQANIDPKSWSGFVLIGG